MLRAIVVGLVVLIVAAVALVWLAGGSFRNTAASCTTTSLLRAARADRKGHRAVGFRVLLELPLTESD